MAANPRAAAVAALVRQEQDGFSNLILDAELRRRELDGRDKAFASAIFYTVLEHRGTLDYILEQFLPKGLAKLDAPVREILRAAVAQARYMQVPVSAAVNEAVKLTRSFKKSSASGLVNAVLRKACVYDLDKAVFKDEIEKLMVLGSASREVAEFLHRHYPEEALTAPQTVAAGKPFVKVKLGGGTFYFRPQNNVVLEAGSRYKYTVKVNTTGLTLEGCTIGDWADGGGESGEAKDLGYIYDSNTNTYTVYNADGLMNVAELVNGGKTDINITLDKNIDLTGKSWTPIGTDYDNSYTGTFDGGGHTITANPFPMMDFSSLSRRSVTTSGRSSP